MDENKQKRQELVGKMPTGQYRLSDVRVRVVESKPTDPVPDPWAKVVAELMCWRS